MKQGVIEQNNFKLTKYTMKILLHGAYEFGYLLT